MTSNPPHGSPAPGGNSEEILWGRLTSLSLLALGLAVSLGILGSSTESGLIRPLATGLAPAGEMWIAALRMSVIPLVLTQLLRALVGHPGSGTIGRVGAQTIGLFLGFIAAVGLSSVVVMPGVVRLYPVDPDAIALLRARTVVPPGVVDAASVAATSIGDWIQGLVPPNVLAAATAGEILPLLVFTAAFGLAVRQLPEKQRDPLAGLFQGLAEAMLHLVFWILWLTPLAVFSLVLGLTLDVGADTLGLLTFYVIVVSVWMLTVTGALHVVAPLLAGVSIRAFARAMVPAQMVAVSTRSSIASLPALIEGGQKHLDLGPAATGFVLPLSASMLKLSTMTAEPVRFFFLAHIFGMDLGAAQIATFMLTLGLLSFSGVGVPRGGSGFDTVPAYLAAGIPLEGVVLVVAVDTIPDIAKTLINVTGYMSVATLATSNRKGGEAGA